MLSGNQEGNLTILSKAISNVKEKFHYTIGFQN